MLFADWTTTTTITATNVFIRGWITTATELYSLYTYYQGGGCETEGRKRWTRVLLHTMDMYVRQAEIKKIRDLHTPVAGFRAKADADRTPRIEARGSCFC